MIGAASNTARTLTRCTTKVNVQSSFSRSSGSYRQFHLAGQDAVSFFTKQAPEVQVEHQQGGRDTAGTSSISILLHADRRPLALKGNDKSGSQARHFGPALLACQSEALHALSHVDKGKQFGQGDLGMLQLQKQKPEKVHVEPITLSKGLSKSSALAFVQSIPSTTQQATNKEWQDKAADALVHAWQIFSKCEGVWFTFSIGMAAKAAVVQRPFLDFDDFAIHRVAALKDWYANRRREENSARAEDGGLFYIKLPARGNVGSFGYGAGNAMATMDGLALVGGRPANFLDGGGGANKANAKLAIETLDRDADVTSIFVNTFGGITQTDVVAEGMIEAVRENKITKPITVRVLGTGAERAKELLQESGLGFAIEDDFKTAARAAVQRGSDS